MQKMTVSKEQTKNFLLAHQGLASGYAFNGNQGILQYIDRVGCIQFDPLNIVGYNHELVLQSRIRDFRPSMLQKLLYQDRKLLDGWDKNMSIYGVGDWPYFKRNRDSARQHLGDASRPAMSVIAEIHDEMEKRGPLSSSDLGYDQTVDWSWSPTRLSRAALESMYFWGELIIHHKSGTRRIYDLASRHIPKNILDAPEPNPTMEEFHDWYALRRLGSIGLLWNRSGDAWLGISGMKSAERNAAFSRLLAEEKIIELHVEDVKLPLYARAGDMPMLLNTLDKPMPKSQAFTMAPLDNLLWDRQLIRELFDFDYRWEVYKPAAERQYGYYVLPVLYGNRFIARFEPGRDKKTGNLIIKNWWWEPEVKKSKKMYSALSICFKAFMEFMGAKDLEFHGNASENKDLEDLIRSV